MDSYKYSVRGLFPVLFAVILCLGLMSCEGRKTVAPRKPSVQVKQPAPEPSGRYFEVRAMWATRWMLTSPQAITKLVQDAVEGGFNTIFAQVRGRGDALYRSGFEPRSELLKNQPEAFDPLADLLEKARSQGIMVHAWLNVFFVAGLEKLPESPAHVVYTHPEWLMLPRQVAAKMKGVDPGSKDYLKTLVEVCKKDTSQLEGLYLSPGNPLVIDHLFRVYMDVVEKYPAVDGIHFDFVRFPNPEFDYNPVTLEGFKQYLKGRLKPNEEILLNQAKDDALSPTRLFPDKWGDYRRSLITGFVEKVFVGAKGRRPDIIVSAAVFADEVDARTKRFQDWRSWLAAGILDALCPMAYTQETKLFERQIQTARGLANGRYLWAGIGAWKFPPEGTLEKIDAARKSGADGFILFSYDRVSAPSNVYPGKDYLQRLGLNVQAIQ